MRILYTFLLLSLMIQLYGQEEPFLIKLKRPLNTLMKIPFHCEGVIDMRRDSIIGQHIRKNKRQNILLAGNFERTMKKYISYLLPKTNSSIPLYFIFRDIHIPEFVKNRKHTRLYMQIEFAAMRNDSLFSLGILDQHAANYTEIQASTHYTRFTTTLNHLIKRANYFKFHEKSLNEPVVRPNSYTLNNGLCPPRGLYTSLAMLKSHIPIDHQDFNLQPNENILPKGKYYTLETSFKKNPYYITFISTGDSLYLNTEKRAGNRIIKLNHLGRYIYFYIQKIDSRFLTGLGELGFVIVFGQEFYRNSSFILDTETNHIYALNPGRLYQISHHIDPSIIKDFLKTERKDEDLRNSIEKLNTLFDHELH